MKRIVKKDDVLQCLANGIKTAKEISKVLNFDTSVIYSFCKRHNIELVRGNSGGHNKLNMSGLIINGLKIISEEPSIKKRTRWLCECPCGKQFVACGPDIRNNKIKTCGCRISIVSRRNWQGYENIPRLLWSTIVKNAESRKLDLTITIEYLNDLIIKQDFKCALSGIKLVFAKKGGTASLDRIDSSKGYIEDNVQWIHKDINFMKQDYDEKYFIDICTKIAKYKNTELLGNNK